MVPRKIVSRLDLLGGCPTVDGTRLSCADIAHNLEGLGLGWFCEVHVALTRADVLAALDYCAEQRCVGYALAFCHSCQLRPDEPHGDEIWLLSDKLRRTLLASAPDSMTDIVHTSVAALVANPREFDGKRVQVAGYVVSHMEVWGIFDSETDRRKGGFKRGIWLETYGTPHAEVDEAYAVVEGTYDVTSCGHLGMWSGTIREVTRLEPLPPNPT